MIPPKLSAERVDELITKVDQLAADTEENNEGLGAVAKMIKLVDWRRRRNAILLTTAVLVGIIAIAVGLVVGGVYFSDRHAAQVSRNAQADFRFKQSEQTGQLLALGKTLQEQNIRLQNALDPNGCVAQRGQASTALLLIDLKNTVWVANGHPENQVKASQALIDASKQVCAGDPGGPPLVGPDGQPIPPAATPKLPAGDESTVPLVAPAGSSHQTSPPSSPAPAPFIMPPRNPPGNTPIQVPLPPSLPQPGPVMVPNPNGLLTPVINILCNVKLVIKC